MNQALLELLKAALPQLLPLLLDLLKTQPKPTPVPPSVPGFDDAKVVEPPPSAVNPPLLGAPKLAAINLKIQWAADGEGNLRNDTDAIAAGTSALNWNRDIRFDTDTLDQFKRPMPPRGSDDPIKRNWTIRWVSPDGAEIGTAKIIAPDTVENTSVPVRLGTGVYDRTFGFCLKMQFVGPLNGRYRAFVSCDEDGIRSNEVQVPVD